MVNKAKKKLTDNLRRRVLSRKRAGDADISSEVVWLLAAFWDVLLASVGVVIMGVVFEW